VLIRTGRELLSGRLEVDETFFGGAEPCLRGACHRTKKTQVVVALEVHEPKCFGRSRMRIIPDASAESLHPFVSEHIVPGTNLITDARQRYASIATLSYTRERRSHRAVRLADGDPHGLLPGVHRIASLAERWLPSTHQGSVDKEHLQAYSDEFVFRFNRRGPRSHDLPFYHLLEVAVGHDPVRYGDIVTGERPRKKMPTPTGDERSPASLKRPPPWPTVASG